jgi:hypothetical protein
MKRASTALSAIFFLQIRLPLPILIAGVAQSVEQRTRNAKVVGSIPISGTNLLSASSDIFLLNLNRYANFPPDVLASLHGHACNT